MHCVPMTHLDPPPQKKTLNPKHSIQPSRHAHALCADDALGRTQFHSALDCEPAQEQVQKRPANQGNMLQGRAVCPASHINNALNYIYGQCGHLPIGRPS
jgi:hypothetical protein